jgi:hypothetical protein
VIEGNSVLEEEEEEKKIQANIIGGYCNAEINKRPHKLNYVSV